MENSTGYHYALGRYDAAEETQDIWPLDVDFCIDYARFQAQIQRKFSRTRRAYWLGVAREYRGSLPLASRKAPR